MKIMVDIKDQKAAFILELLNSFSFVKTTPLTPGGARFLSELKSSVQELNQINAGKSEGSPVTNLLSEL
jgi:hypothetical protein